jgi:hypothetical protein
MMDGTGARAIRISWPAHPSVIVEYLRAISRACYACIS